MGRAQPGGERFRIAALQMARIEQWAREGLSDTAMAERLGVTASRIWKLKKRIDKGRNAEKT
jgi:hypothetical protein